MGLELALKNHNINFVRSKVGDRNILELLNDTGGNLGGEASGHMICMDYAETGDGLIAAIQVLEIMKRTKKTLSELMLNYIKLPQVNDNIKFNKYIDIENSKKIKEAVNSKSKTDAITFEVDSAKGSVVFW